MDDKSNLIQFLNANEIIFKKYTEVSLSYDKDGDEYLTFQIKLIGREYPIFWTSQSDPEEVLNLLKTHFRDLGLIIKEN